MLVTNTTTLFNKGVPNVIKIRDNVPLPAPRMTLQLSKYGFISALEVGQSFEINGDTPDYNAKSLAPAAYAVANHVRRHTTNTKFTVSCRTLKGTCKEPVIVGCWRTA